MKKYFLLKKYFFDPKKSKFRKNIFAIFEISISRFSKISKFREKKIGILILWDRKNIFSSKNIFSLFFHKICSILTKYEGITPKTPKVRLIFRFLALFGPKSDFFPNGDVGGPLT